MDMPIKFYVIWEFYNYETGAISFKMEQADTHDAALDKYFKFLDQYVNYGTVGRATARIMDSLNNRFEEYVWIKENIPAKTEE